MKIEDLFPSEGRNRKKAKKIRLRQKDKAKSANPGDPEERADWGANPYLGTFDRMRMGVS